jgi:IS30 family transposase
MTKESDNREKIVHKYLENPSWSHRSIAKALNLSNSTVSSVIKRYKETLSTDRAKGSGRKKGFKDPKIISKVKRSLERNPDLSYRERAKRYGCSRFLVGKVMKEFGFKSYEAIKQPNRTEKQNLIAKKRARKLYDDILLKFNGCILMDDETYVKCDYRQLPGSKFYTAIQRLGADDRYKFKKVNKFGKKFMIWQAICSCGKKTPFFITSKTMTSKMYISECLEKRLLPFIKSHKGQCLFWPDLASCHYSKQTLEWYQMNGVKFVKKIHNPPNCPDFRPIEKLWAIGKQILFKSGKCVKSAVGMRNSWTWAMRKVSSKVVRAMMAAIKNKVREFIRND